MVLKSGLIGQYCEMDRRDLSVRSCRINCDEKVVYEKLILRAYLSNNHF